MKNLWKYLLVFVFLSLAVLYYLNQPIKQNDEVSLYTDKVDYSLNDTVKIFVNNRLDKSIWGFNGCGNKPFWGMEKLINNQWEEIIFSFPSSDKKCVFIVCEPAEHKELKSHQKIEDTWQINNICEWPTSPVGVPETEVKIVEKGRYRIFTNYASNEADSNDKIKIYSNEFKIN